MSSNIRSKNTPPDYQLRVRIKSTKSGRKVATVRILGKGEVKWRRVSVSSDISDEELHKMAIRAGKKYCQGKVIYQGFMPVD